MVTRWAEAGWGWALGRRESSGERRARERTVRRKPLCQDKRAPSAQTRRKDAPNDSAARSTGRSGLHPDVIPIAARPTGSRLACNCDGEVAPGACKEGTYPIHSIGSPRSASTSLIISI